MNLIGFNPFHNREKKAKEERPKATVKTEISPTVVQIFFPDCNRTLAYYNDRFDLHVGDIVFVDGKLEGVRGRVTAISTHFKIKVEDYKRVISVADTHVTGQFFQAGTHLITFDPMALTWKQFCSWVKASGEDETEYYISYDEEGFPLDDLSELGVSDTLAEWGLAYYRENRVSYLCLNGSQGRAIVEGTKPYELEFQYKDGQISSLFCDCPCGYTCKHDVAVLLQLRETLEIVEEKYADMWANSDYFAIVFKPVFYRFAVDGDSEAVLRLG